MCLERIKKKLLYMVEILAVYDTKKSATFLNLRLLFGLRMSLSSSILILDYNMGNLAHYMT